MKRLAGLLALLSFLALPVQAATSLPVSMYTVEVFRHVIEINDWLVLARVYIIPDSRSGIDSDSATISTTSGDFDDPLPLVNRILVTGSSDFTVVADATTITSSCTVGASYLTINCADTGLADASYTVTATYRTGWGAYAPEDVLVRLKDGATTVVAERSSPATGYTLQGIYLTAAEVTAAGLTWQGGTIEMEALAASTLWASPCGGTCPSQVPNTWHSDATHAALVTTLTARLKSYLSRLEQDDPLVSPGAYVTTTGITAAGATVALNAFSLMQLAIPEAFQNTSFNPATGYTPSALSVATSLNAAASDTALRAGFTQIGADFGIAFFLIAALVGAAIVVLKLGSPELAALYALVIMVLAKIILGASMPTPLVFLPIALVIGTGMLLMAKAWVFD